VYKDVFFGLYYFSISIVGAFVNTKVKTTDGSLWPAIIISQVYMLGGLTMLKYSELPLIKQSAIITLMSRFGYLIGLVWAGESIVTMQWAGVVVMLVGTILTNYH